MNCTLEFMCLPYVLKCHIRPPVACVCLNLLLSSVLPLVVGINILSGRKNGEKKRSPSMIGRSWLSHFTLPSLPLLHPSRCSEYQFSTLEDLTSAWRTLSYAFLKHREKDSMDLTNSKALKRYSTLNWST